MERNIFRKEALERLSSPEGLDSMIQIINPLGWSLLGAAALLFAVILVWGFFGTISYKIKGEGMLINEGGIHNVFSAASGQINEILVDEGDIIEPGETIAFIDQAEVSEKIKVLKKQLEDRSGKYSEILKLGEKGHRMQRDYLEQRYENLLSSLERCSEQEEFYKERLASQENLLKQGLITKAALMSTQEKYHAVVEDYNLKDNELKEISASLIELNKDLEEQHLAIEQDIQEKKGEIEQLEEQLRLHSAIVSRRGGRVLEIKVNRGDYIPEGSPIVMMESIVDRPEDLKAIVYVTLLDGKRVKSGMEMHITPSTVKKEEHGFIYGKVESVSTFPSTYEAMMRVLRNNKLVEALSAISASYEVRGTLAVSPLASSGYKWSSSKGPSLKILSGTFCDVSITIEKQHPVSFILPFFRHILAES